MAEIFFSFLRAISWELDKSRKRPFSTTSLVSEIHTVSPAELHLKSEAQETRDTDTVENKQIQPGMTSYSFRRFQFKAVDLSTNMYASRRRFHL